MILPFLKEMTAEIHAQVESVNSAKYILNHTISKDDYFRLLAHNFETYSLLEKVLMSGLNAVDSKLGVFVSTEKSERLYQDLKALDTGFVDRKQNLTIEKTISKESEMLGILYVIEGSMLGGLVIGKHLDDCDQLPKDMEHQFYGGNPQQVMSRWKSFQSLASELSFSETEKQEALSWAKWAFKTFETAA